MKGILFLVPVALLAATAYAQPSSSPPRPTSSPVTPKPATAVPVTAAKDSPAALLKNVSLDASGMDIREALRSLSGQSGAKILMGPELTGKVTTKLADVPLEVALSTIGTVGSVRWSGLSLPAEKAEALTAEEAELLVAAADTLRAAGTTVSTPGKPAVSLTEGPAAGAKVYLVQARSTRARLTLVRPDRDAPVLAARETEQLRRIGAGLSEDARQDPYIVKAYSDVQQMDALQLATLAREYLVHATPEQRQAIVQAVGSQAEKLRGLPGLEDVFGR